MLKHNGGHLHFLFLYINNYHYTMKSFKQHILEKLKISKTLNYTLFPETKTELKEMIEAEISKNGNECSLNHIDVSRITDMSYTFINSDFNGDISKWNVSNVERMDYMFYGSKFNGDISEWDVSTVTDMSNMFAQSDFNGDISKWDVSNVKYMVSMFSHSKFRRDISDWDVSNVLSMKHMFPFVTNLPKWYKR